MYSTRTIEMSNMMKIVEEISEEISIIKNEFDYKKQSKSINIINYIQLQIDEAKNNIEDLKNPFLLFIIGSGNYGKSTLINALLNQTIVDTNDIPNTWKLDIFTKSPNEKMEIYYEDKTKISKSIKEGKVILENEEKKFKESKKKISNLVNKYKKENKSSINELKEYKKELEEKYLYKSNIIQIKYYLKKGNLLNDFIIVDTPGLNQTLLKNTSQRMKEYYIKADGVIWLIDACNIVSNETNKLIEEINYMDELYEHRKNMIAVVNKIDIIKQNNLANLAKVRRCINQIYKDKFDDIVYISAKNALEGLLKNDINLINESNIKNLYKSIDEKFTKICEYQQINSKYRNLEIMKNNIINEIHNYKRELYKDISIYNEIEFEINKKSDSIYEFSINYIENLKNKDIYNSKVGLILKEDIENLQNYCSIELKKLYDVLYQKIRIIQNDKIKNINTDIYFSKSKNLIIKYKEQNTNTKCISKSQSIFNNIISNKSNELYTNEFRIKTQIHRKIDNLKEEISQILKEEINFIKDDINKTKEKQFEEKYLSYSKVKVHTEYLSNIEKILNNLG